MGTSGKDQEDLEMITWGITTIFQEAQRVDHHPYNEEEKQVLVDKEDDDETVGKHKTLEYRVQVSMGWILSKGPIHNRGLSWTAPAA